MNDLDTLRRAVLDVFPTIVAEVGSELSGPRRSLLDRSRERLESGQYLVVVCGEFRRGKSSLLNALVERKALFPVDSDVTTSVVSTLEWSETEQAVVHFSPADPRRPDSAPAPQSVPLAEIVDFVTEQANPHNKRDVVRVAMQAPIEQLRSGLVLVDTPGVGSLNPAHTAATRAILPRADAILFVCSAAQPPGTIELDFLAHALAHCPIVLTAVTMIDKPTDPGPGIEAARSRIADRVADVTGIDAQDLVVVGVSSLRKRKGLDLGDDAMVASSGFPALEAELWGGLGATCGRSQLSQALDGLDAAVGDVESPLLNELAALEDDGELARIDAELRDTQSKIKELRTGSSKWRRNLSEELETESRAVRNGLTAGFEQARDRFRDDVHTDEAVSDPNAVVSRASVAMVDVVNRADADLAVIVADVALRYARTTSVTLTASGVDTSSTDLQLGEVQALQQQGGGGFAQFRRTWGGAAAGGGAASMALWAVSFVFPVAGIVAVAGAALGFLAGLFGGNSHHGEVERAKRDKAARQHLKDQVLHKMDSAKRQAERDFTDKLKDVTRELTAALDDHLAASADSLGESVTRLQETRRRTAVERTERRRVLQERRARYVELHTRLDALRGRIAGLLRPTPAA